MKYVCATDILKAGCMQAVYSIHKTEVIDSRSIQLRESTLSTRVTTCHTFPQSNEGGPP